MMDIMCNFFLTTANKVLTYIKEVAAGFIATLELLDTQTVSNQTVSTQTVSTQTEVPSTDKVINGDKDYKMLFN
jgi:hypothetical protein